MKLVRLIRCATITGDVEGSLNTDKVLTKRARFVYVGKFDSMDGEVDVTKEHIEKLVAAHNAIIDRLAGDENMVHFPPVQVDHSTSGWDTVGRVVGTLEARDDVIDGKTVLAMFGTLRFLGADAVDRVNDGRWTHLSLGADLDGAKLNEMTVTPFPAAPKASLLSKLKGVPMDEQMAALKKHLMESDKMSEKDADDKLSKMTDDEKKEMSGRLAAPKEEPKDEPKPKDEKMAAVKTAFAKLTSGFKTAAKKTTVAVKTVQLTARLNGLRAKGKLTPAEQKGIDLAKLGALDKAAQDFFFDTYEKRGPVVLGGVYGRTSAEDIAKLAGDVKDKSMLKEMSQTMHFSRGVVKRLAEGGDTSEMNPPTQEKMSDHAGGEVTKDEAPTSMDSVSDLKAHFSHLQRLVSAGQMQEAQEHLSKCMATLSAKEESGEGNPGDAGHSNLSALAENVQTLQNQFDELVQLAQPILGTTEE